MADVALQSVTVRYGQKVVLDAINIAFSVVGISFVIGENGAGKTQLLRTLHGLVTPDSGRVLAPPRAHQAYLRQQPIWLNRSVMANLRFVRGCPVCPSAHFDAIFDSIVAQFELSAILKQSAKTLSGGQRKRVALARLFLQKATLWLLDEPSANIDHYYNTQLENLIHAKVAAGDKVIIATHDFFQLQRLFQVGRDELLIIKDGCLAMCAERPNWSDLSTRL